VGLVGQAQGGVLGMRNPHSFTHLVDGASVSGKYPSVHSIRKKAVWSTFSDPWSTEIHFRQLADRTRMDTLLCCDYKLRRQAQTMEMKP
jgi:hypothetical protein